MYYDDLPVWGFIGKMEKIFKPGGVTEFKYFLFTHVDFDIKYNDDRVIEINVSTDPQEAVDISENVTSAKAKFTYSVKWSPISLPFERRLERYEKFPLNPVHLEVRGARTHECRAWAGACRPFCAASTSTAVANDCSRHRRAMAGHGMHARLRGRAHSVRAHAPAAPDARPRPPDIC
jgi:hypothetical protein